jgi:hypothetical protein
MTRHSDRVKVPSRVSPVGFDKHEIALSGSRRDEQVGLVDDPHAPARPLPWRFTQSLSMSASASTSAQLPAALRNPARPASVK